MPDYELICPVNLNIVLFKAKAVLTDADNKSLVAHINKTGKIFITPTKYAGQPALRVAVCNWMTTIEDDLAAVFEALSEGMASYLKSGKAS